MASSSPAISYKESLQDFPSALSPVSCLCGEEQFYIDQIQEKLSTLLPEDQRDFNLDLFYGSEITVDQLFSVARSYPMMAEKRVVIVREFMSIKQGNGASFPDLLEHYLAEPNPLTLLCLIDSSLPDKRTALGKLLTGKKIRFYPFDRLPDYKVPDWIQDLTQHRFKKKMDAQAAVYLSELVGNDLRLLSTEVEKVSTFVDTKERITKQDVEKITGTYKEKSVIELSNAIFSRNLDQALKISEQVLLNSETGLPEVLKTIGLLTSSFSNVWQILRLKEKRYNLSQIQEALNIPNQFYFKRLIESADSFQLAEMPSIFEALLDADRAAKGFTTMNAESILPILVHRILSTRG